MGAAVIAKPDVKGPLRWHQPGESSTFKCHLGVISIGSISEIELELFHREAVDTGMRLDLHLDAHVATPAAQSSTAVDKIREMLHLVQKRFHRSVAWLELLCFSYPLRFSKRYRREAPSARATAHSITMSGAQGRPDEKLLNPDVP